MFGLVTFPWELILSPLLILYGLGILVLLSPFLWRRRGIPYAFTRFFSRQVSWRNKEKLLTTGIILGGLLLFGFLFFRISQDSFSFPSLLSEEKIRESESPVSLVIVDISGSMTSQEIKPNRYELARQSFFDLTSHAHPSWKIGLVVFSDEEYLARIPSYDRRALHKDALEENPTDIHSSFKEFSSGTEILEAVEFGLKVLTRYPLARERSIVLISDMEYPDIKLAAAFSEAYAEGIKVHLVIIANEKSASADLLGVYFGEKANALAIFGQDDLTRVPDFSRLIWNEYPLAGNEKYIPFVISPSSDSGVGRMEGIAFFGIIGSLGALVVIRGTLARRVP